ncbi:16S rRNA (cytosine(967)-C(5))-methyltransferase [Gammaproteobacteria bacterium 54_18_T64]|nr:16S rRNA (cytosine(967)-C(5))-methyltransferase [Gammaproteobacteria bacterium 54_18_T64]
MLAVQVRVAAAKVLLAVIRDGVSLNQCLPEQMAEVVERDRPLLQELSYGTLRWYPRINTVLNTLIEKPFRAKDRDIHVLLACALYQLMETRIPDHAAVNETVAALKKLKKPWAKGLVNGVLRRFIRERDSLNTQLQDQGVYRYAHPKWLCKRIEQAWPEQAAAIFAANNHPGPMTLRVNRLRQSRADYLDTLQTAGIAAQAITLSEDGVQLHKATGVDALPGFADGLLSVQDEAAQLAAQLLELEPGQRVLDACCAPGGKTCHILEREPKLAELVALDIDDARLGRVKENFARLKVQATLVAADAAATSQWWDGQLFDRILLDAPCSATGVIRRHPDIKLLRKPDDIARLAELQAELLDALWPLLKSGGKLLYATCSILPEENDASIAGFIARQSDAEVLNISVEIGRQTPLGRQLLPTIDGHDGFYYALLCKG